MRVVSTSEVAGSSLAVFEGVGGREGVTVTVTEVAVAAFLKICVSALETASVLPASPAGPPEPSAVGAGDFPLASANTFT